MDNLSWNMEHGISVNIEVGISDNPSWLKWPPSTRAIRKWIPMRKIVQLRSTEKNEEAIKLERQNLILFIDETDNKSNKNVETTDNQSNKFTSGMNFLNRFVAEETDQFEVYAFYQMNWWVNTADQSVAKIEKAVQEYAQQSKRDKTDENTVHFIWAGHMKCLRSHENILYTIKNEMARNGLQRGMVTFLEKHRYHCVTKEKYEQLYKHGGTIDSSTWSSMELSFGDDLEDFLNRIKNDQIHD